MMRPSFGLMVGLLVAGAGWAATVRPLTEQERGFVGATHVATITHADLTETNAATPQTLPALAVTAKQRVELIGMELVEAFNGGGTTGNVYVCVGDGAAGTNFYLNSTELNNGQTSAVWKAYGKSALAATSATISYARPIAPTVTLTLQTAACYDSTGAAITNASGPVTVVTGATATATLVASNATVVTAMTDSGAGRKVYTATDTVDFTFIPDAYTALSANTVGEVRFYFRIIR